MLEVGHSLTGSLCRYRDEVTGRIPSVESPVNRLPVGNVGECQQAMGSDEIRITPEPIVGWRPLNSSLVFKENGVVLRLHH